MTSTIAKFHKPAQHTSNRLPTVSLRADSLLQRRRQKDCACGGTCSKCRVGQFEPENDQHIEDGSDHSWSQPIPGIVGDVLNSAGEPLDAGTRAAMEPRFGHDFGKVRVHSDARAAESARSLHALAYTVGSNIVFGAGQYKSQTESGQHLLAHELTHVVQQRQSLQPTIQRQDDEKQQPTPTGDEMMHEVLCGGGGGGGLFGRTQVSDLFQYVGAFTANFPEFSMVEIQDLRTGRSDAYRLLDWLNDEWQIVEIASTYITVLSKTCRTKETLSKPKPKAAKIVVEVSQSNFGPGTVTITDDCQKVVFEPDDQSKPKSTWTVVTKGESDHFYIRDGDEAKLYPPPDVENYFGLYLLSEKCGTPKPKQREESTPEDLAPTLP